MPDKDIFDRTFAPGWANSARQINKVGDPEIAAHAMARALRKDLRAMGGLPDSKKLHTLLLASQNGNSLATSDKVFKQIRDFERSSDNRDLAGFLGKTYRQIYIETTEKQRQASHNKSAESNFPSQKECIKRVCLKLIDYRFHDKVELIERSEQRGDYWHEPNFKSIYDQHLDFYLELNAQALDKDPTFRHPPKYPRVKQMKQSTEDMMYSPIRLMDE